MSDGDLDRVIDDTTFALEICSSGNDRSTHRAVNRLRDKGQLARLTLGTDTPGGTGVIPRGMLRNICAIARSGVMPPGRRSRSRPATPPTPTALDVGILAPGRPGRYQIPCGPVEGPAGTEALPMPLRMATGVRDRV